MTVSESGGDCFNDDMRFTSVFTVAEYPMKQVLMSLVRRPLSRVAAAPKAPVHGLRELDRASLRLVAGGDASQSPRTGW